jgi:Flp pilus assembly protein TadD
LAAAHNNLGFVCLRLEDYAGAVMHFHEVGKLEPQNVEAWDNLGFVYEKQGMIRMAEIVYMQALRMNPEHQEWSLIPGLIAELEGNFAGVIR